MLLLIKEVRWTMNRVAVKRTQTVTTLERHPCVPGPLPPVGRAKRKFSIDRVQDDGIVLSVITEDPRYAGKWELTAENGGFYAPRSFGAGYQYDFQILMEDVL